MYLKAADDTGNFNKELKSMKQSQMKITELQNNSVEKLLYRFRHESDGNEEDISDLGDRQEGSQSWSLRR